MAIDRPAEGGREDRKQRPPVSSAGGPGRIGLIEPVIDLSRSLACVMAVSRVEWSGRLTGQFAGRPGDSPMPGKTAGRPRKRTKKAPAPKASPRAAPVGAGRYIADQLKAIYDAVVAEPVPDRLLQLLNRLDSDAKK
jgi:hypothetical protein